MPTINCEKYKIISSGCIAKDTYSFIISAPEPAAKAIPGQFVHILCGDRTLRRPISICEIDKNAGTLRIVFQIRGEGTQWLSQLSAGDDVNMIAPLGNGYLLPGDPKKLLLAGGGIGVPPLLGLAGAYECDAVLGFRDSSGIILREAFEKKCGSVKITTEDGSAGSKGFVTTPLAELLNTQKYDAVCACGPTPMLKSVAAEVESRGLPCFVSLEERMACGVGACLGCAVKLKGFDEYFHVCKAGPVFDSKRLEI